MALKLRLSCFLFLSAIAIDLYNTDCVFPHVMHGRWLSYEKNHEKITIIESSSISGLGVCHQMVPNRTNYRLALRNDKCYYCVEMWIRTINVIEKRESGCKSSQSSPTIDEICGDIDPNRDLITLFKEDIRKMICRSSIEGEWQFAYRDVLRSTGECDRPGNIIRSCQNAADQFLIANQQFEMNFTSCSNGEDDHSDFSEGTHEFSCLGDWRVGKNHYFAVASTTESRSVERFRCFLKHRDDEFVLGKSITPECNVLKTPDSSPARLSIKPVKPESVTPGCQFPDNFTGLWVDTGKADSDIEIGSSVIIETHRPNVGRVRTTTYTCMEDQDSRFMVARQHTFGCATDYVCYEFLPRHHNIIRYRRGKELTKPQFHTVCAWHQFENQQSHQKNSDGSWLYGIMIAKELKPVACPVAGMFRFEQSGEVLFRTRILQGITEAPRPDIQCNASLVSEFSACNRNQDQPTVINVDVKKCYSVDQQGLPIDIYSQPDHQMQCAGFWFENLRSYMITYEELDPISKYRCWVYQKIEEKRVKMTQSIGSYCNIRQTAVSTRYTDGVAVALDLFENERENDRCPMDFRGGDDPWRSDINRLIILNRSGELVQLSNVLLPFCISLLFIVL